MKFLHAMAATALVLLVASTRANAADEIIVPLWPDGAPGFEDRKDEPEKLYPGREQEGFICNVHYPTLTVYLPEADKSTGAGVIICPGGGHVLHAIHHEGYQLAEWFRDRGIAAFVLKYRLFREQGSPYTVEHPIQDGERAVRLVRSRASEWGLRPDRIGILGFSAGGHIAKATSEAQDKGNSEAEDPIERISSRPDFQVLVYPGGLNGPHFNVSPDTPPTLLICAIDDRPNISEALPGYMVALKQAGIPVEMHMYGSGGHGFGVRPGEQAVNRWPERTREWLTDLGMLAQ